MLNDLKPANLMTEGIVLSLLKKYNQPTNQPVNQPTLHIRYTYQYIYLLYLLNSHHHHHHHVVPLARISLTLSRHFSLSFIAFGRSSGLHPVSSHSCCMYVRAGRPAFAWLYAGSIGVHHEFVLASPAVSSVSGSSNLYSFRDGRPVAV